jgi:hypothetical protein
VKIRYEIEHAGEPDAGLPAFSETVTIEVGSDPGGMPGEFVDFMREAIEGWFDGARVDVAADDAAADDEVQP